MKKNSIIIVDDDAAIREILCEILINEGHYVQSASHGLEASHILREVKTPQLFLVDLMMPFMDGRELLLHIREHSKKSGLAHKCIIMSAGRSPDLDALGVPVLKKPVDLETLLKTIETHFPGSSEP